jgi:peptidoglycan L-alanyl-D-glutamate endopeptidase CwlK
MYSQNSLNKLNTCHTDLQEIFHTVNNDGFSHTIICGHRNEKDQNAVFATGASTKKWPDGEHNSIPSMAVDAVPDPIEFPALDRGDRLAIIKMGVFAGYVLARARDLFNRGKITHRLKWGGDWDGDWDVRDQKFNDWVHFELIA